MDASDQNKAITIRSTSPTMMARGFMLTNDALKLFNNK